MPAPVVGTSGVGEERAVRPDAGDVRRAHVEDHVHRLEAEEVCVEQVSSTPKSSAKPQTKKRRIRRRLLDVPRAIAAVAERGERRAARRRPSTPGLPTASPTRPDLGGGSVHSAAVQPIVHASALGDLAALRCGRHSVLAAARQTSRVLVHAPWTRSARARRPRAPPRRLRNRRQAGRWSGCAGNGPPSPVNETWSIGW